MFRKALILQRQGPVTQASVLSSRGFGHWPKLPSHYGCPVDFMREAMHASCGVLAPPVYRQRDVAGALPLSATTTYLNSIQSGDPSGAIHAGQPFVFTRRDGREDSSTKLGLTSPVHTMLGSNNSERQSAFLDN